MNWKIGFLLSVICNIILFFLLFFKKATDAQQGIFSKGQREKEGQDITGLSRVRESLNLLDKEITAILNKISDNDFVVSNEFNDLDKEFRKINEQLDKELLNCPEDIVTKINKLRQCFEEEKTEFAKTMLKTKLPVINNVYLTASLHKLDKNLKDIMKSVDLTLGNPLRTGHREKS